MSGIVIIGAGECGVRAAFALREQGYEGRVTLVGDESSLPYERPPLSKSVDQAIKPIRSEQSYNEARIERRFGARATGLDPAARAVKFALGPDLSYDQLLLATGARARLFPGLEQCLTLRTDKEAEAIHAHFASGAVIGIIGGGFVGLELAATARKAGAEVTVIEAGSRVLARAVPQEIADVIRDRHAGEGVQIVTDAKVSRADDRTIVLVDGTTQTFDAVIAGVGAMPNTELAVNAGIAVDNGIVVNGEFRTSDPHIFAAGDCCNFEWRGARVRLESWQVAQDQGSHAAAAMLGVSETYSKVPWFWSDQYDLTLQVAGLFDQKQPVLRRGANDDSHIVFQCDDGGRLIAAAGVGPGNAIAKDIRILVKLMERNAAIDARLLADPNQNLKRFLGAA